LEGATSAAQEVRQAAAVRGLRALKVGDVLTLNLGEPTNSGPDWSSYWFENQGSWHIRVDGSRKITSLSYDPPDTRTKWEREWDEAKTLLDLKIGMDLPVEAGAADRMIETQGLAGESTTYVFRRRGATTHVTVDQLGKITRIHRY
jgi:hypothetical protein